MRRTILASLFLLALSASAGDFNYLLTPDGNTITSGGDLNISIDRVVRLSKRWEAPYLWVTRNGQQYLIRDASTLGQAFAAFADSNSLHAEEERLERRMRPIERQEERLEDEMDELTDELSDNEDLTDAERGRMERRVEELEAQIKPVRRQLRALEEEEERLDDQEERLTAIAEKKLRDLADRAIASGLAQPVK